MDKELRDIFHKETKEFLYHFSNLSISLIKIILKNSCELASLNKKKIPKLCARVLRACSKHPLSKDLSSKKEFDFLREGEEYYLATQSQWFIKRNYNYYFGRTFDQDTFIILVGKLLFELECTEPRE